jgi:dimethylargininase
LKRALVRPPGASFAQAISSRHLPIDVALAQAQHAEYCQALAAAGVAVEELSADERYPDSCFMQDPAVVVRGRAIIGRMAAPSRQGEEDAAAQALAGRFPTTRIVAPGTLEGGDILILPDRIVVGETARTNRAGIAQLVVALAQSEDPLTPVYSVPVGDYLHLLSAVTYAGGDTLIAVEAYARHPLLAGMDVIAAPPEEAYAVNTLGLGDSIIVPAGFPRIAAALQARGFAVLPVPVGEFAKADGGVTCLSLVWGE